MKLSQKLLKYDPYHMTPSPGSSGIYTSSKTPGRDLEDRWSLDRVSAISKFFRNLHILQDSRERLGGQEEPWQGFCCFQVLQEPPHPPRLRGETWRTGGVLTVFLMLDLDETFCCFQVFQEPPHPPRLQGETWRTGGVLTRFMMLDIDETFTETSDG